MNAFASRAGIVITLLVTLAAPVVARAGEEHDRLTFAGLQAFTAGDYIAALARWQEALAAADDGAGRAALRARRAEAYQALGHFTLAEREVEAALDALPGGTSTASARGRLLGILGRTRQLRGDRNGADAAFLASLELLSGSDPMAEALTHGYLASLHTARDPQRALSHVERSVRLARDAGVPNIAGSSLAVLADIHWGYGESSKAFEAIGRAESAWLSVAPSNASALGLLALVERRFSWARENGVAPDRVRIERLLARAVEDAQGHGNDTTRSYAQGLLGAHLDSVGEATAARERIDAAIALATRGQAWESLYRWQAQLGRWHRRGDDNDRALDAFEESVATLTSLRGDLAARFGGDEAAFRATVAPVLHEFVSLLLDEARRIGPSDPGRGAALRRRAREATEQLRTAELENYFGDDCVANLQSSLRPVDRLDPGTAVLYPLLMGERAELLLSLAPDRIEGIPAGTSGYTIERQALDLLRALRNIEGSYTAEAAALSKSIIAPIEHLLRESAVHTLVVVPDGVLRTVPLSVLPFGGKPILDAMALAVAPGLSLLDPRPLALGSARALLAGMSIMSPTEHLNGLANLPGVARELTAVASVIPSDVLLDDDFTAQGITAALRGTDYRIVHIASHTRIGPDASDTFIVSGGHERRFDMDALEALIKPTRYRSNPVELLTLSACETAVGNPRSALGLAGIAIKAGARSALASLWQVEDAASVHLVRRFYSELAQGGVSKAEALRRAQRSLAAGEAGEVYRHPYFWAPFLIIGNWL